MTQANEKWQKVPNRMPLSTMDQPEYKGPGHIEFDAKRLVAQVCRSIFHPCLQGYFFRTYVILSATEATPERGLAWCNFLALINNPPDSPPPISLRSIQSEQVLENIDRWWNGIVIMHVKGINQFVEDLITVISTGEADTGNVVATWQEVYQKMGLDQDVEYLPDHGLALHQILGPGSMLFEQTNFGGFLKAAISRGGKLGMKNKFMDDPTIFDPIVPDNAEGRLALIKQAHLLPLSYWFAANQGHLGGDKETALALMAQSKTLPFWLIAEDIGGVFSKSDCFKLQAQDRYPAHIKQKLVHQWNKLNMEYISGVRESDRVVSAYGLDAMVGLMRDLTGEIDNGRVTITSKSRPIIAATATDVDRPEETRKPIGAKEARAKRDPPKKVSFVNPKKEVDEKGETMSYLWFAGLAGLAFLIARPS